MAEHDPESSSQEEATGHPAFEERQVFVKWPENFVYTNASAISVSLMDVRLAFADAGPDGHAETKFAIVMTHEHAAHITLNLLAHLNIFENNFGLIRLPQWREFKEHARAVMENTKTQESPSA
jgi:hypothetical protein